jgi:hypothetical protein
MDSGIDDRPRRRFSLVNDTGDMIGRFIGFTPKQAAKKAFSSLYRRLIVTGNEPKGEIKFTIKDFKSHKLYHYVGERIKYEYPAEVILSGKLVRFGHHHRVYRVNKCNVKSNEVNELEIIHKSAESPRVQTIVIEI